MSEGTQAEVQVAYNVDIILDDGWRIHETSCDEASLNLLAARVLKTGHRVKHPDGTITFYPVHRISCVHAWPIRDTSCSPPS